jgi:hypothetical protein
VQQLTILKEVTLYTIGNQFRALTQVVMEGVEEGSNDQWVGEVVQVKVTKIIKGPKKICFQVFLWQDQEYRT